MPPHKIITRIKGGLGNQLFCYAAARRLALVNNAELVIDDVTGFVRDRLYCRRYMLDRFCVSARKATPPERMEPFDRYRRWIIKCIARRKQFVERRYIEQEGLDFDPRLLEYKTRGTVYLDGLWQSEGYFKDIEATIREDLRIVPPTDALNQAMARQISDCNAVALHVRWFDGPNSGAAAHNMSADYYMRAVQLVEQQVDTPQYFIFSDDPDAARAKLSLPESRVTVVSHNRGDETVYADLWLMTQCKHFIIANSTFSWWGAWLANHPDKIVIASNIKLEGITAWGFRGLIPDGWIEL